MKVAVFTGIRDLEVCERPMPVLERPGDVLLQIETVGVCGSDIHYYTEGRIGGQVIEHPEAIDEGDAQLVEEVSRLTSAGAGCGSCQCRIQRLLTGLPAESGPCAQCPGCGSIRTLCECHAA